MSIDSKSTISIDTLERLGRTIKNIGLAVADTQEQLAESNQDRKKDREQMDRLAEAIARMETQINFLLEGDRRIEQIPTQLSRVQADQKNFQDQLKRLEETIEKLIAAQEQKEEEVKKEKKELNTTRINARNSLILALISGVVALLIPLINLVGEHWFKDSSPPAKEMATHHKLRAEQRLLS